MLNTTIQLRIDSKTKKQAQKKFRALGLDLSSAMKLFLRQAITNEHLSFTPAIHKWTDLRHWRQYEKEIAWTRKHGKRYTSVDELMKDLNAD
ncbi:MAG: type II toxin-antitoxin system RelB/DinJ family antitoxin [Parcubacteria group bacterium]|nr:type II toxin-antitoxin system RelB/DinJ family antitoxin [Parcubacteria group bacterium]